MMIMRMWHGVTEESVSEEYVQYILETGVPLYRSQEGNKGVYVLRRIQDGKAEFYMISFWETYEAIKQFAGPEFDKAKYFDGDSDYLIELESHVKHFDVLLGP